MSKTVSLRTSALKWCGNPFSLIPSPGEKVAERKRGRMRNAGRKLDNTNHPSGFILSPFLTRHGLRRDTLPPGEGISTSPVTAYTAPPQ